MSQDPQGENIIYTVEGLAVSYARGQDATFIADALKKCYKPEYGIHYLADTTKNKLAEGSYKIYDHKRQGHTYYFVAKKGNTQIGFLNLTILDENPKIGYFGIVILPSFQGKGMGGRLVTGLKNWAETTRLVEEVWCFTRPENLHAIKAFNKAGGKKQGTWVDHRFDRTKTKSGQRLFYKF